MLTLQNEPPSLESVSEDKEQYKNYGKSIRKMIADCLQKDPAKRPSATELLKYSFFKKAKDRKYLISTLLTCGPSIEERAKKAKCVKRPPGTSGRLHRTNAGDWVWSDDEVSPDGSDGSKEHSDGSGNNTCNSGGSTNGKNSVVMPGHGHTGVSSNSRSGSSNPISASGSNLPSPHSAPSSNVTSASSSRKASLESVPPIVPPPAQFGDESTSSKEPNSIVPPINLVLRMRNSRKELNDIRFEFNLEKDTADGIAQELVQAGLVDVKDVVIVAANLHKLVNTPKEVASSHQPVCANGSYGPKSVVFALHDSDADEEPDEKALIGFAQLSISD